MIFLLVKEAFISCELAWRLGKRLDVNVVEDCLPVCVGSENTELMIFPQLRKQCCNIYVHIL